jgi:L-alanine-DL-glutamate epimerase-like enolase superfamily enzyme
MDTIYFSLKDDVLKDRLDIVEGSFSVPDKPGLGVEVDMDKIEKYSLLSD